MLEKKSILTSNFIYVFRDIFFKFGICLLLWIRWMDIFNVIWSFVKDFVIVKDCFERKQRVSNILTYCRCLWSAVTSPFNMASRSFAPYTIKMIFKDKSSYDIAYTNLSVLFLYL